MDKYLLPSVSAKMESTCAACNQQIISASIMKCGGCKASYHPICVNAPSSDASKLKEWKCPTCRASEPRNCNLSTPALSRDRLENPNDTAGARAYKRPAPGSPDTAREGEVITQPDIDIAAELRLLRLDMAEIKSSLKILADGMALCNTRLDNFDSRIQSLEERDTVILSLQDEVSQLKHQLNYQSQNLLNKELEILGVKEATNENLEHIIMVAASKVGVNLPECEIDWVMRAGPKHGRSNSKATQSPRPIIAKLSRKTKRDEILKAAKVRRHSLTSADLNLPDPPNKIYINEHLTKANRLLFRDARLKARESGFRFCWVTNGRIHLRRDEGKPAIPINIQADLERVLSSCNMGNPNHS